MDRFSVCAAYHWYATLWIGGQQAWDYAARLRRVGYAPSVTARLESETPEAREAYGRYCAPLRLWREAGRSGP
jgi:hypothetical protein